MTKLRSLSVWFPVLLMAGGFASNLDAALVGFNGYTNDFSSQPSAADWSTFSIAGAAADITSGAQVGPEVQLIAAGSITGQTISDATAPPAFNALATWSSAEFYLQTRPTGNRLTLLMCTLTNNLGSAASDVTISYGAAAVAPNGDEIAGHNVFYSLTGAAGSWIPIPSLSSAVSGRVSATLGITWPSGGALYVLWADDNSVNSPDTANQIDNFSAVATPSVQSPAMINTQPQSQTIAELAPVNFTVGVSGNPPPTFQWYRNDAPIASATSSSYSIASAALSDNAAQFKVVVANTASNVNYSITSSVAVLTVNADTTPPGLVRAVGVPPGTVTVEFSEPIRADTASILSNYSITSSVGNLTISSAVLAANGSNVTLATSLQTLGTSYTLIVNGIRDRSAASNQISANSIATFTSIAFVLGNVGSPSPTGTSTPSGNGFDITAGGLDIGGTSDQFAFNYQNLIGDFDVKVRVAGLSLADAWAKAGLMARESLTANSPFAAALATPSVSGAFFESRSTAGGAASASGSFGGNYPNMWLRLQRSGNIFTGYAGLDGQTWSVLGSATIAMANSLFVGAVVSSHTNGTSATAQFRDYSPVTVATIASAPREVEPAGPSSRRTPIAFTEIMYNPFPDPNSNVLEFIEIYNSNPYFEDISGYRISGDIDFTFPPNTVLKAGEYRVIARNPAHVMAAYGISGVMGSYSNALKETGTIRLRNREDAILLEVNYANSPPWPPAADGAGHSLVLARPSLGEGDVQAWGISDKVGGSPGGYDGAGGSPQRAVVINEFFANSALPDQDYIELYNHSNQEVDLSGCTLSDEPHTNKFVMPPNTIIQPRSFLVFYQDAFGFGLSSGGETIYFRAADGTRVLDAIRFEAQATGVASGRHPDGAREIYPLTARTPGGANAGIRVHDIVINEIMYNPISGLNDDEYVELYNKGVNAVNIGGWKLVGGIDYRFPSNVVLAANGYLVVAKNTARLTNNYANLNTNNTYGNFSGSLRNKGDRVALAMPDLNITTNGLGQVQTNRVYVVVDEVTYGAGGQWGKWANEGGSSLELIDPRANHRLAYNWADSDETAKAPWTTLQATGAMDLGAGTANYFEILALNEGEWLIDNVEVLPSSGVNALTQANSDFEGGQGGWLFRGTHIQSSIDNAGGFGGGRCLHVRATARGDSVHNRCLVPITTPSGAVTLRAKVRWLRGWPEMLVRLHGNYLEATGPLLLPANLGTPGARNSQAVSNAPPAIYAVTHSPLVPAANQAVVVTARVYDPDGLSAVSLRYRLDPSSSYTTVAMTDNGTGADLIAGDGVYSGTILGQSASGLVAYYVEATDDAAPSMTVSFPRGASPTTPECLVRFGDPVIASGFGTYRMWMTTYFFNVWNNRPALSNERIPVTLVYGNYRAIQLATVKWAGSPYHQFGGAPNTTGHYSFDIPEDDLFLGTDNLNKIHAPGNGPFDDGYIQREQTCYWFARQLSLPWNYRRCVNVYFNGTRPGGANQLMEDTETPGNDVVESRFPDDPDGNLYKLQPWFEVDDGSAHTSLGFANNSWCDLTRYTTTSNGVPIQKLARVRHNFLARAVKGSANDYSDVFALKDAADTVQSPAYIAGMQNLCDMEQWMRTFAVHHSVGDWDHFGSRNSQNMYGYKTAKERWKLMIWDMNIVIGNGSSAQGANLFEITGGGANMQKIYDTPLFRRMYFRALKELCNGAFLPANMNPVLDSKYAAYLASGVSPTSPQGIKDWMAIARTSILTVVAGEDAATFKINGTNFITTSNNLITITGEAPVEARTIKINGVEYPITWTSVKAWTIRLPVANATNVLSLQGYDINGNLLAGFGTNLTVIFTGVVATPEDSIVFNEIMYNPLVTNASYVEIMNRANFSFDISGWRVNGLDFTFPEGSFITNRHHVLLVKDRTAVTTAYGAVVADYQFDANLDPDGETLTLIKPGSTNTGPDVIIDKVRYEARRPWTQSANGGGASLQLLDASVDNSRVSDWSDGVGWRSLTTNINIGSSLSGSTNLYLFLDGAGDFYLDDITLVAQTGPTAGINIIQNSGFEAALTGSWNLGANMSNSAVSTQFAHSGNASVHLVSTGAGAPSINGSFWQTLPMIVNTVYTLNFYYVPSTNANKLTSRWNSAARPEYIVRLGNTFTPGAPNFVDVLPPYDPLWLNEIQPNNLAGPTDGFGQHDPWVELYNAGTNNLSLDGYYLGDNYTNGLTRWPFPASAVIGPGEFKVIWLDGQTEQSTPAALHANFRPPPSTGQVALVRFVQRQPQVVDYLTYSGMAESLSYGDYTDGQPFSRQVFYQVTPGATNVSRSINVFINEWMASNTNSAADPASLPGFPEYDDWFELYNGSTNAVDLSGYYLTDSDNKTQFRIPTNGQYTIPAGGFMLVWADNQTNQNSAEHIDLHVNFQLNKGGEAISLTSPDGETVIDKVTFATQYDDVSQGRFTDGAAEPFYYMTNSYTPRQPNALGGGNQTPVLAAIPDKTVTLGQTVSFTATATDSDLPPQTLTFSLDAGPGGAGITALGSFTWNTTGASAPSTNNVTVRVTDNGSPARSSAGTFKIYVVPPPHITVINAGNGQVSLTIPSNPGHHYQLVYKNSLGDPEWLPLGGPVLATGSSLTFSDDIEGRPQRFYQIVPVD